MALSEPRSRPASSGQFVLLHEDDNILVCARSAAAGTELEIDGHTYILGADIELGHKIARRSLTPGEKVLRYGIAIGSMTAPAATAEHVHSHNLKSDYISAHGRDAVRIREIRS